MSYKHGTLSKSLTVVAATVFALAIAGCASSAAEPEEQTAEVALPTSASTPPTAPRAGESAISTDHVCGQVTAIATMEGNTAAGFAAGVLTVDQLVAQMDMVATGYEHVLVNDSEVGDLVTTSVIFLKTAEASPSGARFDHESAEWQGATSAIAAACHAAGSSISMLADFGG